MKIWYMIIALVLTSCATVDNQANGVIYNEYKEYKALVNAGDEVAASTKISQSYLEGLREVDTITSTELGLHTPYWKYFANIINTEYSHFEKIDGDIGCLTINGLDKLDRPRSLSLYYIREHGNWVFNRFGITAHSSIREYYTEPTCPNFEPIKIES
jgi:hypothetical protein